MAGLRETAAIGNRLETLRAVRDAISGDIDMCDSMRDKAALYQRLSEILSQIDAVEKAQPARKGTALDELTRRRAQRQAPRSKGASS